MRPLETALIETMQAAWESLVREPPLVVGGGALAPEHGVLAFVTLVGETGACVLLRCSHAMGDRITRAMFALDSPRVSDDDICDAFGELANVVGGNLREHLPGPTELSPPVVVRGFVEDLRVVQSSLIDGVTFAVGPEHLSVELREYAADTHRRRRAAR